MTKKEILELIKIFIELCEYIRKHRQLNELAKKIQFPKTPQTLSESLALNLLCDNVVLGDVEFEEIQLGGRVADIIGIVKGKQVKIEIKATVADFQYFGNKDIHSDYLIWIDLINPLRNNKNEVNIYVVPKPERYFNSPRKISLTNFLNITNGGRIDYSIDMYEYLKK